MKNQNQESGEIDYERLPAGPPMDKTDVTLRAYLIRVSDEHHRCDWTNEQAFEVKIKPRNIDQLPEKYRGGIKQRDLEFSISPLQQENNVQALASAK